MEQRKIGQLSVSVVGVGCNQFGTKGCDEQTSLRVIAEAVEAGITYFDTADEYGMNYTDRNDSTGWGRSETIVGKALKAHRDEVVIATKFGAHPKLGDERGGNSARWIRQAVEDSLSRLGTDHIDLYQAHFPDATVPIDETLGALAELVTAGKVREIGCCNFTGAMLTEAADAAAAAATATAARSGSPRFVSVQNALNLFQRQALDDPIPTCQQLGVAFIPYYPLASGMLTGKYRRGEVPAGGTRLTEQVGDDVRAKVFSDRSFARVEGLEAFAKQHGHTLLELAFGWLLSVPTVATVIAGAAKPGQATANAQASGWRLTSEETAAAVDIVKQAG